jgi:hypothetical protein
MISLDPIIAVKDVEASTKWYQDIFLFKRSHGGDKFSVLVSEENKIILCLHKWDVHHHPTMISGETKAGHGIILYFRTNNMVLIYQNAIKAGCIIAEHVHLNTESLHKEFSVQDPDGYFLTVSEFHTYEG